MLGDIDRLRGNIESDTRNMILTLARTWSAVATGVTRSKDAVADWVFARLPEARRPVLARARAMCVGDQAEGLDDIKDHIDPHVDLLEATVRCTADQGGTFVLAAGLTLADQQRDYFFCLLRALPRPGAPV